MAGDDDEMFGGRSLSALRQEQQNSSDNSVAYVTNNKRLCSTFSTIEANY